MNELVTRASEAQADELCPGRALAQFALPEKPAGPFAEHGRAIHHALATGDTSNLDHDQIDIVDSCQKIVSKVLDQFFGLDAMSAINRRMAEHEFSYIVDGSYRHVGHPDVVFRHGGKVAIPDFKSLPGSVSDADSNRQMRDYAVIVNDSMPLLEQIATIIIQPLVTHAPTPCIYTQEDLVRAEDEMIQRIRRSHDPKSPRIAGPVQCQWCRAKGLCNEYAAWVSEKVPVPASIQKVPVALWSPEQRVAFCQNKTIAAKWLKETEEAMKELLRNDPNAIPGWELRAGNEVSTITNPQLVFDRFITLGGTLEQYMACLKVTNGKLEEQVAAVTGQKGLNLDKIVTMILTNASETKQNDPSLKRKD